VGEAPPPPPRACFGRDELVGRIVGLAEDLSPVALIGAGGIGKTSIALTVLHHDRIIEKFGGNRRFIRCDQFPASRANFLRRLSQVIGAGVENPENLIPLRPSLASKEMLIVLDNAESILDPQGGSGQEIYAVVEELSQFNNVCLCITSRLTIVPPDCETLDIPTLPMEAARDAFYRIYKYGGQSDSVNNILKQLDFHPLSVTLLATVAHQNKWDNNRLAREWKQRQTAVLQAGLNRSLAHTIELSLASPMFRELGPQARGILEVVAFFPQGIDENNLGWLFPDISNRSTTFDTFCVLSLTYRNNGFVTMLAPLRDYLRPKDPMSSPLLCATKDRYFIRMSVILDQNTPAFTESRWIMSEDVNTEHLVDIFTSIDANTHEVWEACGDFTRHLRFHKPRHTVLMQKIEGLPDDHRSKPECLFQLAQLFKAVGNHAEQKKLLKRTLEFARARGDDTQASRILRELSDANRMLGLYKEGIQHAGEAFEINQRLGTTMGQARCLIDLALLLRDDGQLDAAEEAGSRAIDLLPEKGQEWQVCHAHRLLGGVHRFKGERVKAIHHFEAALAIASPSNWYDQMCWIHYALAGLFLDEREFDSAHAHIGQAKSHAVNDPYNLGRAMESQARIWHAQGRGEEAKSEALCAFETYKKLGAVRDLERCGTLLQKIERAMESQSTGL
jgi:tetratricopeptide (TPR) repeat protein